MAYTRIHAIKSTVTKAIAYICNPEKTEEKLLVDTFGCGIETAKHDFDFALSRTKRTDKNLAFHLIQSFAKGEVSHEEAHLIGIELADKLLEGKYSYIVATHTDKGHPHNHIIFCAADNIEHKKYYDTKRSYHHIRELSDELCKEHNLSVIIPSGVRGKKYTEWKAELEGNSWKKRLKEDIDECIRIAKSYDDFLLLIKGKGYTVYGDKLGDPHAKYIKFLAPGQERPIRGSFKNFGSGYTKEDIKDRIENPEKWHDNEQSAQKQTENNIAITKRIIKVPKKDILTRTGASKTLIDTSGEKFQNSPGLQHWASIKNLKTAASSYAAADNLAELHRQIEEKRAEANSAKTKLVELEHEIKKISELLLYAEQYIDNKSFHNKYKKSKDPDRYLRMHETQLILFDGAERMLRKIGLDADSIDITEIKKDYDNLTAQKTDIEKNYKSLKNETTALQLKSINISEYISQNKSQSEIKSSKYL
ncbi:Relaxase/Mobilisation nuclease domain-containing protein [Butyrivibrio fibrisolvens DSM 3071]|uniref:Relaxase/Mobilisation nuclease domain-containing protein n=1 Tax=Butyrivibrio fibrisolvens DSM 3071 TaxID=1121131 RepID=A0A1M5Q1I5_BUTFI|nr:relaxase/mobilization nuclease domain-containing protein [Butyrivibrio fibrisolvens]SHH07776.1 Relaxase/Mobilisation nuclease domain-containing protein [Butyrivibrio fibrisolvens DSM 3071]